MASSLPLQVAETIQTASINTAPSPAHDINPSTAASKKTPVELSTSHSSYDEIDDVEEDEIPYAVLKPIPRNRRPSFGPLPDLRFEQSYLASIAGADSWWKVGLITVRDQVCMPLLQGVLWSLIPFAWRHWNRNAELSGSSTGAKVRRWWYRTNNWKIPEKLGNKNLAEKVGDFYQNQSSSD